jgi:regulator of protease activity HflC (stomatin/prohibitin superfamily)
MTTERRISAISGWIMLVPTLLAIAGAVYLFVRFVVESDRLDEPQFRLLAASIVCLVLFGLLARGLFALQPNQAAVLNLFGAYVGTARDPGFWWTNPFNQRTRISLRARNEVGEKLKVNDKRGNPIEIAAVTVWCVQDTARATFDVDHFEQFVRVQSEAALRALANRYAYDHSDDTPETSLRNNVEEVSQVLKAELQGRVDRAGVLIEDTRLAHLAYAPEIAGVMLRRQQAEAIIDARQKIVHGAVSMVEMALADLAARQVVVLDDERKAAMVGNLLVVLCGEAQAQPIVNAGTLYG